MRKIRKMEKTRKVDLHIHSTVSDGTLSPSDIVKMAESLDLAAIALTDHDTVGGIEEFLLAGNGSKVVTIPGVEIAAGWNFREVHVLGLWIDHTSFELNELLKKIRKERDIRNSKILEGLRNDGFEITMEELRNEAKGEAIGRPHIASILFKKKYFKTIKEVFSLSLARGAKNYVSRVLPEISEVIDAIHTARGLAIWAHPVHRNNAEYKNLKSEIIHFASLGLDGIEAYYSEYSEKQNKMLLNYASDLNLQVTGGSDFHGEMLPNIKMATGRGNLSIPDKVFIELKDYYQKTTAQK